MNMSELDRNILFEDADLLVLNKPAGWVVNRSHTQSEPTIQDWMEGRLSGILMSLKADLKEDVKATKTDGDEDYGTPEQIFVERGGVAHRLDKDTSGVLILAKNPSSLAALMRQFKDRNTTKTYLALVHGKVVPMEGIINLPTERSSSEREKFAVSATGKASETQYKVLEHFPGLPKGMHQKKGKSYQGFTLLELVPKTGRTHQIRVHMSAIKHPLVGDATYAGRKRIELDREWCERHFLHAKQLCITHPTTQENICFESPLPQDLEKSLSKLKQA